MVQRTDCSFLLSRLCESGLSSHAHHCPLCHAHTNRDAIQSLDGRCTRYSASLLMEMWVEVHRAAKYIHASRGRFPRNRKYLKP